MIGVRGRLALVLVAGGALAAAAVGCGGSGDPSTSTTTAATKDDKVDAAISELERTVKRAKGAKDVQLTAEDTIRQYFQNLNANHYEEAWERLSPEVQTQFGGFESWVGGYETTESTTITGLDSIENEQNNARYRVEIKAVDAGACDAALVRNFAGEWALVKEGDEWTVTEAAFAQVGGESGSVACGSSAPAFFTDLSYNTTEQPGFIQISNHDSLSGVSWSSWGSDPASGNGTLRHLVCDPYCAAGYPVEVPVSLSMNGLADCGGRLQYASLSITLNGSVPDALPSPITIPNYGGC